MYFWYRWDHIAENIGIGDIRLFGGEKFGEWPNNVNGY